MWPPTAQNSCCACGTTRSGLYVFLGVGLAATVCICFRASSWLKDEWLAHRQKVVLVDLFHEQVIEWHSRHLQEKNMDMVFKFVGGFELENIWANERVIETLLAFHSGCFFLLVSFRLIPGFCATYRIFSVSRRWELDLPVLVRVPLKKRYIYLPIKTSLLNWKFG